MGLHWNRKLLTVGRGSHISFSARLRECFTCSSRRRQRKRHVTAGLLRAIRASNGKTFGTPIVSSSTASHRCRVPSGALPPIRKRVVWLAFAPSWRRYPNRRRLCDDNFSAWKLLGHVSLSSAQTYTETEKKKLIT